MNYEILDALSQITREKSVDRQLLVETLEAGLASAVRKKHGATADVEVKFSNDTGQKGDGITRDNTLILTGTADANSTVTVFRDARHIVTAPVADLSQKQLVAAMTGEANIEEAVDQPSTVRRGEAPALEVRALTA